MFAEGCGDYRAKSSLRCLHESRSHNFVATALQNHFRQWLRRRPIEHLACRRGKYSAMTRARKHVLFGAVENGASVMRAQPAERGISIFRRTQQKTRPVILRISEHRRATHRNFPRMPDHFHGVCNLAFAPINRKSPERSQRTGEAQPTSKSAAAEGRFIRRQLFRGTQ